MSRFDHDGPLTDVERDELAAYSLGSLDSIEQVAVENHLEHCKDCRAYLRWLHPAIDLLPAAVGQEDPPPSLRRELMATVRAEAKAARRAERQADRGGWSFWGLVWRPATAIAVSAVLIVGVIGGYALRGDDAEPRATLTEAVQTVNGPQGSFVATLERVGDKGTLHVEKMPVLPRNRVYQLWIGRNGDMQPSTPFVVRHDGTNEVAVDGSLAGADGVFVTREPEGGSEQPSQPVVLKAPTA